MTVADLELLLKWCGVANSSEEFWRRFVAASICYDQPTQAAMLALVHLTTAGADGASRGEIGPGVTGETVPTASTT